MIRRVFWLLLSIFVGVALFYISRFWVFDLWSRGGLFGIQELRPQGGLLALWLRGTMFAPFELLIWLCGVFLALTWLEKLYGLLTRSDG